MNRLTERIDGIVTSMERYEKHSPCHHCRWQSTDKCLEDECTYGSVLNKLAEYEDMHEKLEKKIADIKSSSDYPHNFTGQMAEDLEWVLNQIKN